MEGEKPPPREGDPSPSPGPPSAGAAQAAMLQSLLSQAAMTSTFNRLPATLPGQAAYQDIMAQALAPQLQPSVLQALLAQSALGAVPLPPQPVATHSDMTGAMTTGRGAPGRARSAGDGRTATNNSYASRHQQAEARRRSRINERLDALRKIVPHTERANTATFLEDVVRYVQRLQHRVVELELKMGLAPTVTLPSASISFGDGPRGSGGAGGVANNETGATTANNGGGPVSDADRLALQALLQSAAAAVGQVPPGAPVSAPASAATGTGGTVPAGALPSTSEELAMAAQLAPPVAEGRAAAMMAESQPIGGKAAKGKRREQEDRPPAENPPQPESKRRKGSADPAATK